MKKLLFLIIALVFLNVLSFGQTNDSLIFCVGDFISREPKDSIIVYVPKDSKVKVIEQGEEYCKVMYKNYVGWVLKVRLVTESEYNKLVEEQKAKKLKKEFAEKQAEVKAEEDRLKAKQDRAKAQLDALNRRRSDLTQKYGSQEIAEKILAKKIWLGMTDKMARESWGAPIDINRSVGAWGTNEQWVYGNTYLYFENGILTSWQD